MSEGRVGPGCDAHPRGDRCGQPARLYASGWWRETHPPPSREQLNRGWREKAETTEEEGT